MIPPLLGFSNATLQVRMQALKCFSVLAYENTQVSMTLVNGESLSVLTSFVMAALCLPASLLLPVLVDGELLSQVFVRMMQRDQPIEMQLTAAKWLVASTRNKHCSLERTSSSNLLLLVPV